MSKNSLTNTSKFISLILRHKPETIGIQLDEHGWADVKELIDGVSKTDKLDMDILEEIVGEINDEYDEEEKTFTRLNKNTYVFEGKTLLSDFCRILEVDDEEFAEIEGDADTLAGLLLEIKGDFPEIHEKLQYRNYLFEILELEERRISRVKVVVREHNANHSDSDK
jgi:Mg2+/Co2+ transporter CorC